MKNKITHILYSGLGGHGSVVFSILQGDKNNELDQSLIFYGIEKLPEDYKRKVLKRNYNVVYKKKGLDIISYFDVFKFLRKHKPEVVFLHSMNLLLVVYFYSKILNFKLITVEHTSNSLKNKFENFMTKLSPKLSSHLVFLTEVYKNEVIEKINVCKKKYSIINNGIDINFFKSSNLKKSRTYNLIMAARFSPQRDFLTLIDAVALLNSSSRNKYTLNLAGDGEGCNEIEKYVQVKHLSNINFLGNLSEKELKKAFIGSDIYIQSSFGETMSTSIMQAMALGLPVIGSDVKGINDLIIENETGYLFNLGDSNDLTKQILHLENNDLFHKISENNRVFSIENFAQERMFKQYQALVN